MIEVFVLVILSMLVGGGIVLHDGMKGLAISIAGISMLIIFYGGLFGLILGMIIILVIAVLWFISEREKPISRLYKNELRNNMKPQKPIEPNLNKEFLKHANQALKEKYLEKSQEQRKIEQNLNKEYQAAFNRGLRKKYPMSDLD